MMRVFGPLDGFEKLGGFSEKMLVTISLLVRRTVVAGIVGRPDGSARGTKKHGAIGVDRVGTGSAIGGIADPNGTVSVLVKVSVKSTSEKKVAVNN